MQDYKVLDEDTIELNSGVFIPLCESNKDFIQFCIDKPVESDKMKKDKKDKKRMLK